MTLGLHWFRRDLRYRGNLALQENLKLHEGRVLGVFCFDSQFLSRPDFSHHRFQFFLKTLESLKKDLLDVGGDLLVIDDEPLVGLPKLISWLRKNKHEVSDVSFNRDYEPYARQRDENVQKSLRDLGVEALTERDHLIIEPWELTKDSGGFYQIYSPFAKKWFELFRQSEVQGRLTTPKMRSFKLKWENVRGKDFPYQDALGKFLAENEKHVSIAIPDAGSSVAVKSLKSFADRLLEYDTARDFPAENGTSRLSIFLKNGSLTTAQVIAELKLQKQRFLDKNSQFLKELIWREFYYSILYHKPAAENSAFLEKYNHLKWDNNKSFFARWCEGTTGFPIVDAGMRELNQTGWMHNRVRMIVASFLTKDLLISWQWGENYFMKMLLDGDLAPNNGGWQWAASTGCDPQPYFRIFNPWLQSEKFDPTGTYIKKFVPELRTYSADEIHDPKADRSRAGYPAPMVDHAMQKEKALKMYSSVDR